MEIQTDKPRMNWNAANLNKEWKRFKQHCEFTFRGPLAGKTEVQKVNYLMTFIGVQGREIYTTFTFAPADGATPAENETLDGVYAKYDQYCEPKKNEIRATVNFHRRKQGPQEKFDSFVTDLRILVKDCGYTNEDRMLRDAIVIGVADPKVQARCMEDGDELTLDRAIRIGQMYETSKESLKLIGEDPKVSSPSASVNAVRPKMANKHAPKQQPSKQQPEEKCRKCGYDRSHKVCPARGKTCSKCKKKNHFNRVCLSNTRKSQATHVVDMQDEDEFEESAFLFDINTVEGNGYSDWFVKIQLGNAQVKAQIDTGAAQSLISSELVDRLMPQVKLLPTKKKFQSYTKHHIQVTGAVELEVKYKDRAANVMFYVVQSSQESLLLSGQASQELQLIKRCHAVQEVPELEKCFPELKNSTATLPGTYRIKVDPTVTPVIHGPRRQPKALTDKIVQKLREMEAAGQITKVQEPTDWVSSMVAVMKNGKVRICIDPKDLNKAIRREHYPIPTLEEVISSFPGAQYFSVLDAKSGFLQIQLDYESSLLTTFNTPIGRYRWLRLPFGIKSAPEIFQSIMDSMLEGIPKARCFMDDIIIAGSTVKEHDEALKQVIERAKEWNLGLNYQKCQLRQKEVSYHGHLVGRKGLRPSADKVKALRDMPTPESKDDVRRFLGMIQYLGKFIPKMSHVDAPLREMLKGHAEFTWSAPQEKSFNKLKDLCCQAPVLAIYDGRKPVEIQCDASSFALGGVLLQEGKPVAYTSRVLTETEKLYAQIEKEALAIVHCCKKFHFYIFGKSVVVQTDHKPLETICKKPLLAAPMRLQRMMLRLQPYDLEVQYVPGKEIPVADALSRASLPDVPAEPEMGHEIINLIEFVAVSPQYYRRLQSATADELSELHQLVIKGWPDTKQEVPHSVRAYWNVRDEIATLDGLIYKGHRIVVPPSHREDLLQRIHESHMGMAKSKQRARDTLFWPGMNAAIEGMVRNCEECSKYSPQQQKETLIPSSVPTLPWSKVATDILEFKGHHYLVTMDYYSKFIEVDRLKELSAKCSIDALKGQFARHGIPRQLRSDNGPQFASAEFAQFCQYYDVEHVTSSPHFHSSNGQAEKGVQIVENLWRKSKDPYLALLDYRATPMESCGLSPSQLLMSRRLRTRLPVKSDSLQPAVYDPETVQQRMKEAKTRQKEVHDRGAKDLPPLKVGDQVVMAPQGCAKGQEWKSATVTGKHSERSYIVERSGQRYRRNRIHLRLRPLKPVATQPQEQLIDAPTPETHNALPAAAEHPLIEDHHTSTHVEVPLQNAPPNRCDPQSSGTHNASQSRCDSSPLESPSPTVTYTRSGRAVKPVDRLDL